MVTNDWPMFRKEAVESDGFMGALASLSVVALFGVVVGACMWSTSLTFLSAGPVVFGPLLLVALIIFGACTNVDDALTVDQRKVYRRVQSLPKPLKAELGNPDWKTFSVMTEEDSRYLKNRVADLESAYNRNVLLTRATDARVVSLKETIIDRTNYFNEHTKIMKELGDA